MKQQKNNEIDVLLRRLGRQHDGSASGENHLDADQLSAYAENAVPAAARARYTQHLAECSRCRELVVQLSSSAGLVPSEDAQRGIETSGIRKFLATLFSPMVLRYAVPALGLIVVALVGVFMLRPDQRENEQVAQVEQHNQEIPASIAYSSPVVSASPAAEAAASPASARGQQSKNDTTDKKAQATRGAAPTPAAADAQGNADTDKMEAKRAAKEPAPSTSPTVTVSSTESAQIAETQQRPQATSIELAKGRETQPARNEVRRAADESGAPAPAAARRKAPTADETARTGVGSISSLRVDGLNDTATETRVVAGRRFRRSDNIWIDTAYAAPRATVNVTRGSEQYRALVADEPGIKTIAEQLDGEIVVVWKGRVYRIR